MHRLMKRLEVDDIEAGESDSLQKHEMRLSRESRSAQHADQHRGRVDAVPPHLCAQHAVEAQSCVNCAHDQHVTAILAVERRIVEADDMIEAVRHVRCPMRMRVEASYLNRPEKQSE